ncbi:UNVERIFIED_CONTAM: hypothetical protein PYX00_008941 [Menopon gallinae]|uniref:Uncharacterized protein n=1 Tax=Menopon gallinae TaxID=328185 RepID=A0AAW2H9Z9_9NEOP
MIVLCLVLSAAVSAFSMPEPVPYNPIPINNVESAILAISERLRTLDSFIFASPKWELTLDSHSRKLESLESKISRLETFLDLKIDKLADGHQSKTVKEELARDQLSSKIDKVYERLNHRMSYTESRIEDSIVKQRTTLDRTLNGITQQLESLEKNNNEVENDLMEIASNIEDVKSTLLAFNFSVTNSTDSEGFGINANNDAIKKIENIGEQFNDFANKVTNIFHETSLKVKTNEDMLKSLLDALTSVKKEMQDANHNLKSLKKQTCPHEPLEFLIDKVENMARENEDNYERLDNSIKRLHGKQELYQESCHRIQADEPQIENRIGHTLDKILDSIDNRTLITDRNYDAILQRLAAHNYAIHLSGQCTKEVQQLKEQIGQDFKMLAHDITINNPTYQKMDAIVNNLKQLQDQFHLLNNTLSCQQFSQSTSRNQDILNSTSVIMHLIQSLNDSINKIIEKMDQEHRSTFSDWGDADDSEKETKKILDILNVPDTELSLGQRDLEMNAEEEDKGFDANYDSVVHPSDRDESII